MTTKAEPTTLPPAPRTVRRRPAAGRPPWWAAGLFLWVGLTLLGVGSFRLYVAYLGTPVRATIDHLAVNTDNDGTTYRAEYQYVLAGRTHHAKATVSDRLRSLLHHADGSPGDGVVPARAVRLPGGRAFCLLEDGPLTWLMLALSVAWVGILIPATRRLYLRAAGQRRLIEAGAVTAGRVTAVRPAVRGFVVRYAYGSPEEAGRQTARGVARPRVGDPVSVIYDPARPRRSVAYEFADYAVTG